MTILIMVIVGGSVIGFLIASSNSYSAVSSDADLQKESQIAVNQLADMLIDTSHALFVAEGTDETVLRIYNEDFRYVLKYRKAERKLYYSKELRDNTNKVFHAGEESLMAELLKDFRIDLGNAEGKRRVGVEITVERGDRSYHTSDVITLRNKVIVSDTYSEIYK